MRAEHSFHETQNENCSQNHLIAGERGLEKTSHIWTNCLNHTSNMTRSVSIVAVSIVFTFPQGQLECTMELSLLPAGAQREAAGSLQGCQVGSTGEGAGRGTGWSNPWRFGIPLLMHNPLVCQGAGAGLQGQPRVLGGTAAAPAATASSDCSGTAHFNVNFLLLPFEIKAASSLILAVP